MIDNVGQSPLEWAYQSVVVQLVVPAFTPVHVVLPEFHRESSKKMQMLKQMRREVKTTIFTSVVYLLLRRRFKMAGNNSDD
jgi:hypothetical protein